MKHLRLILLLLAVCFTQISFSQDLAKKWAEEDKFKSAIEQVLIEADTEQEAEEKISRLLEYDGEYITKQDKANIANEYFEKCKKKLAKWDAKLAAGKKVYSEDPCMQRTTTSWDLRRFATRTIPRLWNTSSCAHRFLSPRCTQ